MFDFATNEKSTSLLRQIMIQNTYEFILELSSLPSSPSSYSSLMPVVAAVVVKI
jgi:hypothetical protein